MRLNNQLAQPKASEVLFEMTWEWLSTISYLSQELLTPALNQSHISNKWHSWSLTLHPWYRNCIPTMTKWKWHKQNEKSHPTTQLKIKRVFVMQVIGFIDSHLKKFHKFWWRKYNKALQMREEITAHAANLLAWGFLDFRGKNERRALLIGIISESWPWLALSAAKSRLALRHIIPSWSFLWLCQWSSGDKRSLEI